MRRLLLLTLFMAILTGCWDFKDIEHVYYVNSVGVDYKDGRFTVYAQILDFSTLAKQEEGGGRTRGETGAWVGKGHGSTLMSAIHDLYGTTQRKIFWGHLSSIILSENVLEHGLKDVIDPFTRFNEIRDTPWVFATNGSIEAIFLASPVFEQSPVYSQLGDPQDVYEQSSFIRPLRLHEFLSMYDEPGKTTLLPTFRVAKGRWKDQQTDYTELEVTGVYLLESGRMKSWLDKSNLHGLRWLTEKTVRTPLAIPSNPKTFLTMDEPRPKIVPRVRKGEVYFDIHVTVRGTLSSVTRYLSETALESRAAEVIEKEIRATYLEGIEREVDVFSLLHALYRKQPNAWRQMAERERFLLTEESLDQVDVEVRISNTGRKIQ